jgi:hypothetical protein
MKKAAAAIAVWLWLSWAAARIDFMSSLAAVREGRPLPFAVLAAFLTLRFLLLLIAPSLVAGAVALYARRSASRTE